MTGGRNVDFPWDIAMWKVCSVIFNLSTGYTSWEKTIGLMESKKIDVSKIITNVAPLGEWEEIFDKIEKMQVVKAVLIP
jgi:L-iditol 2-dehydrogenase